MSESLSAWIDGELNAARARQLLAQIKRDAGLREKWHCYHLIGDALRGVQGLIPDAASGVPHASCHNGRRQQSAAN